MQYVTSISGENYSLSLRSRAYLPVGWQRRLRLVSTASPPVSRPEVEPAPSQGAGAENEDGEYLLGQLSC